jgi:hypothetical protein
MDGIHSTGSFKNPELSGMVKILFPGQLCEEFFFSVALTIFETLTHKYDYA